MKCEYCNSYKKPTKEVHQKPKSNVMQHMVRTTKIGSSFEVPANCAYIDTRQELLEFLDGDSRATDLLLLRYKLQAPIVIMEKGILWTIHARY